MGKQHLTASETGERIDTFLARVMPEYSRSFWQKLCGSHAILLGDTPVKSNFKLTKGDKVTAIIPEMPIFATQELPIIYEDDDVIVLNKPSGLLTHAKGILSPEFTVAEFVRPRTTDGIDSNRPGIVHRLDRGTSGIIIAAKNPESKRWLQGQFSKRNVKKTYIALIEGHVRENEAIIRLPIERNPKKPQTFRVGPNGKPAETAYNVETTYKDYDLLTLRPLTGRTHQLRVHLSYMGHPIVGDSLYGHEHKKLGRMFLHAHILEITLPSRERKVFQAPLPTELQDYLDALQ